MFLTSGWFMIGWVLFLLYVCFWALVILGVVGVPMRHPAIYAGSTFGLAFLSSLGSMVVIYYFFTDDENNN